MVQTDIWSPLLGGGLIGVAVTVLLYFNGRIAGNSGMVAGLWTLKKDRAWWRLFYLVGLVLGAYLYAVFFGRPAYVLNAPYPVVIIAGLLVGFGTQLGGGCTSGHGICGLARFSKRSIAATLIFMGTGILTVFIVRHWGGGGW